MMPRKTSKRITVKGLFPNAKVVRGRDWIWGDQDGEQLPSGGSRGVSIVSVETPFWTSYVHYVCRLCR